MYLVFIFILLLLSYLIVTYTDMRCTKLNLYLFYVWIMIFFLLSFLRWDRGADWMSYYDYFLNFTKPDEGMFFEFGYQYLSCFIRNVFNNYTILLFVQSLIIYFSFLITIRNFSLNPVFSLLIFLIQQEHWLL